MSTYLKHMGGYTYKQLKGKSFDEIQKLFDKEMKRVNTFVAIGSEGKKVEKKQQESSKKQKVEKEKESDKVDETELKKLLVIKKDEDIAIDAILLATKLPVIIDYKLHKEGMMRILGTLWRIVKAKYGDIRPENDIEIVLWGDLKVMFEPDIRSDVWRMLQGYRVTVWKLIDSSGVHFVRRNLKIQKMNIKFRGGLLGIKRLHGFLEVTAAQDAPHSLSLEGPCTVYCAQCLIIENEDFVKRSRFCYTIRSYELNVVDSTRYKAQVWEILLLHQIRYTLFSSSVITTKSLQNLKIQEMVNILVSGEAYCLNV
ncbi:hypothetical protein Tco_1427895 [Tanacetum coccineum]